MKCPLCKGREHIEVDLHADGFSTAVRECGDCGAIWTFSEDQRKIIKGNDRPSPQAHGDFICPTCRSVACIETDLDAYQFHEELQECTICGTICSCAHLQKEIVRDSQAGSFLSATSELVESDDYIFL